MLNAAAATRKTCGGMAGKKECGHTQHTHIYWDFRESAKEPYARTLSRAAGARLTELFAIGGVAAGLCPPPPPQAQVEIELYMESS